MTMTTVSPDASGPYQCHKRDEVKANCGDSKAGPGGLYGATAADNGSWLTLITSLFIRIERD